jgi:hypothetical protein
MMLKNLSNLYINLILKIMKKVLTILTVFLVVFALFSFGNKDKKAKETRSYSVIMADIEKAIPKGTTVEVNLYIRSLFNELNTARNKPQDGPNPIKWFYWEKRCCYTGYSYCSKGGCGFHVVCDCGFVPPGYCSTGNEPCPQCGVGILELYAGWCD